MSDRKERRWSVLSSLNPFKNGREGDIRFKDDIEKQKVSLCIDSKSKYFGGAQMQTSFFFKKNRETGKVDLTYYSRNPCEVDKKLLYRNCTYFGIANYENDGTVFELTSEVSDSSFFLYCNIKRSFNRKAVVNSVNKLIETVLNENICENEPALIETVLNEDICEDQPSSAEVYPLCHIQSRERKKNIPSWTMEYPSMICYSRCKNKITNYAESDSSPNCYISGAIVLYE